MKQRVLGAVSSCGEDGIDVFINISKRRENTQIKYLWNSFLKTEKFRSVKRKRDKWDYVRRFFASDIDRRGFLKMTISSSWT